MTAGGDNFTTGCLIGFFGGFLCFPYVNTPLYCICYADSLRFRAAIPLLFPN
jgi:hypothetical protein